MAHKLGKEIGVRPECFHKTVLNQVHHLMENLDEEDLVETMLEGKELMRYKRRKSKWRQK